MSITYRHQPGLSPAMQCKYYDVLLSYISMWKMDITCPPAELVDDDGKVKYFLRVYRGGGFELFRNFESEMVRHRYLL